MNQYSLFQPLLFFFIGQPSYPRMVGRIEYALIHLSLVDVAACAGHKGLMGFNENILLIVGDPQGILD
jgi:hypothetical protein